MGGIELGIRVPRGAETGPIDARRAALAALADAGLDHVSPADHVSFFVGAGFDGLIQAAQLTSLHDTLRVCVEVYLLPLRHPTPVARQIQGISRAAPGRLVLGVGVGGEDPHESEVCGVDPRTRGRRADEALEILRGLMKGEPVSYKGEFFELDEALIAPPVSPPVPIVVGGRSTAAVRRAARFGDGYIGVWISPGRFRSILGQIDDGAGAAGRGEVAWQHAMYVWCGFGESRDAARGYVSREMQGIYRIGFENFERYTPYGSPAEVAEFLAPYVEAGCRRFTLSAAGPGDAEIAACAGEVKRLLDAG